ncbi:TATA box-binding protein-associated factor RNA polymerase I subunit C [Coemansia sp. RSA 1813]|nr:TATA box-binding protein-associated factor RNA polymerase I subunit C [Coemansia sp. RSA 1646]KAJ1769355.1 TATA box-binding protein-associated factor RNA polymerase I subunit C [Coemansia sp. RSA 1843]KAJ2213080.1 TATA box-binding protein-associated factor RNA polymerase I subunit C [Coemansia sp. RSA 487]KAJ2567224.1 TATA box-binding protein-associated factor RNA polymerase I subunit C [Coemansia sp. RSA 1813]
MLGSSGHDGYGAFPSIAWPLNRKETGISHVGLDVLKPGVLGGMLPRAGGGSTDPQVSWLPLSKPADRQTRGIVREAYGLVVVRPPTRIPGFLKRPKAPSQQEMLRQMQIVNRELDIPPEIIVDALQEASVDTTCESASPFTGNVVACCRPVVDCSAVLQSRNLSKKALSYRLAVLRNKVDVKPGLSTGKANANESHGYRWSSRRKWALYAGGECNSELWAMPLLAESNKQYALDELGPTGDRADAKPAIEFTTAIRQVSARDSHPGFACVRTDSMVALIQAMEVSNAAARNLRIRAELVGDPYSYDGGDQWTTHVSWSPWNVSELALASGTGAVRLWDCSLGRQTELKTSDDMGLHGLQWNCCEYWNSPRHLLCANPDRAYYLDSRAGKSSLEPLLSLKQSEFAFGSESLTAVLPSELHPMHAVVASTHALRIFDQRYPGKPILTWSVPQVQSDPPVYLHSALLPNYEDGKAAAIFATARGSSQTYSFVYGQRDQDSPYVSLEQGMLKSAASTATIRETIQDSLAIDPQEHKDMVAAHTFSNIYPTAPLAGFAPSLVPPETTQKGSRSASKASFAEVVCIAVDELGKVVGHRLSIAPSANAASASSIAANRRWTDFSVNDGVLVDGMGIVLQSKESRRQYQENAWAEIRKRALAYQRVDMQNAYRYLADGEAVQSEASKLTNGAASLDGLASALAHALPVVASSRKTAFDLVSEMLAGLPAPGASTQLPSWSSASTSLRSGLLQLKDRGLEDDLARKDPASLARAILDTNKNHREPKGSGKMLACVSPAWKVLTTRFSAKQKASNDERYERVVMRAAEDLVLSRISIDAASLPEQPQGAIDTTGFVAARQKRSRESPTIRPECAAAAKNRARLDLETKVAALSGAAGTLRDAWDGGSPSAGDIPGRPAPTRPESTWSVRSQRGKQKQPLARSGVYSGGISTALEANTLQNTLQNTQTEPIVSSSISRNIGFLSADAAPSPLPYVSTPTPAVFSQASSQRRKTFAQHQQRSAAPGQRKKKKVRKTGF